MLGEQSWKSGQTVREKPFGGLTVEHPRLIAQPLREGFDIEADGPPSLSPNLLAQLRFVSALRTSSCLADCGGERWRLGTGEAMLIELVFDFLAARRKILDDSIIDAGEFEYSVFADTVD